MWVPSDLWKQRRQLDDIESLQTRPGNDKKNVERLNWWNTNAINRMERKSMHLEQSKKPRSTSFSAFRLIWQTTISATTPGNCKEYIKLFGKIVDAICTWRMVTDHALTHFLNRFLAAIAVWFEHCTTNALNSSLHLPTIKGSQTHPSRVGKISSNISISTLPSVSLFFLLPPSNHKEVILLMAEAQAPLRCKGNIVFFSKDLLMAKACPSPNKLPMDKGKHNT